MTKKEYCGELQSIGYDIVILNFSDGVDYVENNAMLLVELINRVIGQLQATGSHAELVIFEPTIL